MHKRFFLTLVAALVLLCVTPQLSVAGEADAEEDLWRYSHKLSYPVHESTKVERQVFATVEPFYAWVLAHRFVSIPTDEERAELAAFLMPELIQLLKDAGEMQEQCYKAAPEGDKPYMLEGALLVGLYEGATEVAYQDLDMDRLEEGTVMAPVILLYHIHEHYPKGSYYRMHAWNDELELHRKEGKWLINNIHFPHDENLRSTLQGFIRGGSRHCVVP